MAAHRYWRIKLLDGGTTYGASLNDVELRASEGGADETGAGTATASAYIGGGYEPANAFNGVDGSSWVASNAADLWLKYDFGAGNDKDIVEAKLTFSGTQGDYYGNRLRIEYSDDDATWYTAMLASPYTTVASVITFTFWQWTVDKYQGAFKKKIVSPIKSSNLPFHHIGI